MGFKISWIAFHGATRDQILEKVGFRDTGEADPANDTPFSGADIAGGWFILFSNDFMFVSPRRLASLSTDCRTIACQVHEGVMVSGACSYEQGIRLWEIEHDSEKGPNDLSIFGSPPAAFHSILQRLTQMQDKEGDREVLRVDYIFDVPVETAADACGYRHDRARFGWGIPRFTRLEPVRQQPLNPQPPKRRLELGPLRKLFEGR